MRLRDDKYVEHTMSTENTRQQLFLMRALISVFERYRTMFDMLAQEAFQPYNETDNTLSNETLFEAAGALESSFDDMRELTQLSTTLDDLEHLNTVITAHGVTPSLMAFTNRDNLLSTAIPAFVGCESLDANTPEAAAAQEALLGKIGEVSAAWFKKAWDALSGLGSKIATYTKAAGAKVMEAARSVKGKIYNAAKAAKTVIEAHPIASALAAVAAIAAIAAVVAVMWTVALPTTAALQLTWAGEIRTKLIGAVGKYDFTVATNGLDITYPAGFGVTEAKTAVALGYSGSACTSLVTTAQTTVGESSAFMSLGSRMVASAKRLLDAAKASGGEGLAFARKSLSTLLEITRGLCKFMTSTAVAAVMTSLGLVKMLFGGGTPNQGNAPAAA